MRNDLSAAIRENQFELYFQPIYSVIDASVTSAEVLIRWNHPEYGFLTPGRFIPIFEQDGSICKLDLWVLNATYSYLQDRISRRAPLFPLAVNISRATFPNAAYLKKILPLVTLKQPLLPSISL